MLLMNSEMDGALVRSRSSSSALVFEDKGSGLPSGGCAGIFFQLLHWNRKLAKKLVFPKKVIPSACSKLDEKIFGQEEKIPSAAKLLLISKENNGGFPISKKKSLHHVGENEEVKHGLGSPVLVARLMGLESMPIANNVKQRNDSHSEPRKNPDKRNSKKSNPMECSYSESGDMRNEYTPQKFRRTGPFEKHPIAKTGSDSISSNRLLYNSRRYQAKLISPIKNQAKLQGKCRPRLIGAAKKILEPDLLSKNRAKSVLTYSNSMDKYMASMDSPSLKSFRSSPDPVTKSYTLEITDSKSERAQHSPTFCKNHTRPRVFNSLRDETMQQEASFVGSKRSCGQYTCLDGDIRRSLPSPTTPNSRARAKIHIPRGMSGLSPPIPKLNDEQRKPVQSGASLTSFPNHFYNRSRCLNPHTRPKIAATFKPESQSKPQDIHISKPKKKTTREAETRESTLRCEPLVQKRVSEIRHGLELGVIQALDCSRNMSQTKHRNGYAPLKRSRKMDNTCLLICDGDRDLQKPVHLKGDNLGLFLDHKLKELTRNRGDGFGESAHKSCNSVILHDIKPDFSEEQRVFSQKQDLCCCSDPFAGDLSHNYSGSTHSFITRAPPVSDQQEASSTICHANNEKESIPEFIWRKGDNREREFEQDFIFSRMWGGLLEEVYRAGAEVAESVVSLLLDEALLELSQIYRRLNV